MSDPKIILVDDEEIIYKTVSLCLDYFPCELVWLRDPIKALAELDDLSPDLLIVDLKMPRLNGVQFVSRIKTEVGLKYPTLILTGHGEFEHREQLMADGVFAVMQKPFNFDAFVPTIEAALASVSS